MNAKKELFINETLVNALQQANVVIFAGAGLSAGKPTALPGWWHMNSIIVDALAEKLENSLERKNWLANIIPIITATREANAFPPDYQAQLIHEMCGERYFRGLQAFDVDVINDGHLSIAQLASTNALKAIITTNFDGLIEQALDRLNITYTLAYDGDTFQDMLERLDASEKLPLPIIKIHGSVSNHLSMIDTLKQRKQGRSENLQKLLNKLNAAYWIYLGFSAADLETDKDYLGLIKATKTHAGATFLRYPGNQPGAGAKVLIDAYETKVASPVAHIADLINALNLQQGISEPKAITLSETTGREQFIKNIKTWANQLSTSATGLCLSAILESIGEAEPAIRILDRLVRKDLYHERDTPDFHMLQLQYGRLGAAWGRFIAVPDINGVASNISAETSQSLLRLMKTDLSFQANTWLTCLMLWMGRGKDAMSGTKQLLQVLINDESPENIKAELSREDIVDGWIAASQVLIINDSETSINLIHVTGKEALDYAKQSGDVVRVARVIALKCLGLARTKEDVPGIFSRYRSEFSDAERVHDGYALGMRAMALGRWYVTQGGLLPDENKQETITKYAVEYLTGAAHHFSRQGMDPWLTYCNIQLAKAYADLHDFDNAQQCINIADKAIDRFPVFETHLYEAIGQLQRMIGDDQNAAINFQDAILAARNTGLTERLSRLSKYLEK